MCQKDHEYLEVRRIVDKMLVSLEFTEDKNTGAENKDENRFEGRESREIMDEMLLEIDQQEMFEVRGIAYPGVGAQNQNSKFKISNFGRKVGIFRSKIGDFRS